MKILKATLAVTTTVFVVSALLIATASSRRAQVKHQQAETPNFENFPIVNFEPRVHSNLLVLHRPRLRKDY